MFVLSKSDIIETMTWKEYFLEITQIPRPSGKEEKIRGYLIRFAEERKFPYSVDRVGNLSIDIPAAAGFETHAGVLIQGHMDMVCVKTETSSVNFERDPIPVIDDGKRLSADGTSLGADNGIALALALALCDDPEVVHPPLRLLFTVCEEEGLSGAAALPSETLIFDRLINLDSEEDGVIIVGCAGGATFCGRRKIRRQKGTHRAFFRVELSGLPGGHSGSDIDKNRPNAIVAVAEALTSVNRTSSIQLVSFEGGEKHNVIPSRSSAVINTDLTAAELQRQLSDVLPKEAELKISPVPETECFSTKESETLLRLLTSLPNGVESMSSRFQNTVETSANVAIVHCGDFDEIQATVSVRSLTADGLNSIKKKTTAVFADCGFHAEKIDEYPMWEPASCSPLSELTQAAFRKMTGRLPQIAVIHAGLECGIFASLKPQLDMVSFGPQMENVHSVNEFLDIASADRTYNVLKTLLSLC